MCSWEICLLRPVGFYTLLRTGFSISLLWHTGVLKAYEQVGDADAIPLVERLARRRPRNDRQRQVQAAAEACLPLLKAHVSSKEPAKTLLRASSSNGVASDVLLRAASDDTHLSNDELLRIPQNNIE